ncbi:hypothetical protein [Massilia sp. ST3]|uniref:hypothetical protein n=1 Tax=Massilia sp. ST3 TaxID=2824903 RepID=UPI001B824984|nr:hypothetical protein [Massilia sp. ST3]MBQ5946299.1 hypothetical protein [Massilia sp. ST3]
MKIRFAETTWHTLQDLVRSPAEYPVGRPVVKPARKDMIEKAMSGIYRAIEAELTRMHMNGETPDGSVVLSMDIEIETTPYGGHSPKKPKSLIAELDDVLNKRAPRKKLVEY